MYPPHMARHIIFARQGGSNPTHHSSTSTDSLTSSTSASASTSSVSSSSPSTDPTPPSTSSSVQSTTSTTPVVTTSSSTTSDSVPTSKSSSTTVATSSSIPTSTSTSSIATSSSTLSTSSIPSPTTTSQFVNSAIVSNQFAPTDTSNDATPTFNQNPPATTITPSLTASPSSNLSAGSIVGAVAGTLIGLGLLIFLVMFILRRYRHSRRRALRDSDFGTFRRSMFVTSRPTTTVPTMSQSDHRVAPSLSEPYVPYPAATAQPPSQVPAPAPSGGVLQERPKYVYGQDPSVANQQRQHDDSASEIINGAYSSQPQAQRPYDAEAYGNYAKYEDVDNGVVGGVPTGSAIYQDAQRAYQGQQGYDQGHYGTYDASHYDQSRYGQQQQQQHVVAYGYPEEQQQQHYAFATGSNQQGAGAHGDAYGGI